MVVREVKTKPGDCLLVPGDIHFDKHDPDALALMLDVAYARKVNTVCLVGDTFESAGISRHGRPARKFRFGAGTIAAETKAARPFFEAAERTASFHRGGPGGLHVLTGNHENWWAGVQDEYPGLLDTPWFELYGEIFDGWHVYDEGTSLRFGALLVAHGHRLRGALTKYCAASVLANYPGQNTLFGHTHRVDACTLPTFKYGKPEDHGAWSVGHLRDIADSLRDPFLGPHAERHKQGFALVDFRAVRGETRFKVELVTVDRDTRGKPYCIAGGKLYK